MRGRENVFNGWHTYPNLVLSSLKTFSKLYIMPLSLKGEGNVRN
jgi:hypothetical protein